LTNIRDKRSGHGVYKHKSGAKYDGEYLMNEKHGITKFIFFFHHVLFYSRLNSLFNISGHGKYYYRYIQYFLSFLIKYIK